MNLKTSVILLALLCAACALADSEKELSPKAQALADLLAKSKNDPGSRVLQQRFLRQFPDDTEDFARLFDPADFLELYDGYEYIQHLGNLTASHTIQVGCILIDIAKQARWSADAFNYIQKTTAEFALNHTVTFVEIMKTYDSEAQAGVIAFLADGIHSPAPGFARIVGNLRESGEEALALKFEQIESEAAAKREH